MRKSEPRIVVGNHVRAIFTRDHLPEMKQSWECKTYHIYGGPGERVATMKFFGRNKVQAELDLGAVTEHFGCNRSEAWKIALHLLARAVQTGGMRVSVLGIGGGAGQRGQPPLLRVHAPLRGSPSGASRAGAERHEKGQKQARRQGPSTRAAPSLRRR